MKLNEIASQIKNRTTLRLKGVVDYSHIATKIAGEELARANQYTKYPSKDPYYKASIQIVDANIQDAFIYDKTDNSAVTLAAYLASRVYESKKEENKGKKYISLISKGNEIRVFKKDDDNKLHKVALNGNELAQGVNVEVEVIFFETKFGSGVGINAVIITDKEIKTYEGNLGVKGYEMADDTISLPARQAAVINDVTNATGVTDETPVADGTSEVETDEEPIGSTSAPSNESFDALLAQFKAGN